jgi:hypothetical protein
MASMKIGSSFTPRVAPSGPSVEQRPTVAPGGTEARPQPVRDEFVPSSDTRGIAPRPGGYPDRAPSGDGYQNRVPSGEVPGGQPRGSMKQIMQDIMKSLQDLLRRFMPPQPVAQNTGRDRVA